MITSELKDDFEAFIPTQEQHIDPYFYSNLIQFTNQQATKNTREATTWSNANGSSTVLNTNNNEHSSSTINAPTLIPPPQPPQTQPQPPLTYIHQQQQHHHHHHVAQDLSAYDQFSFGFHPAFSFGYAGTTNSDFTTWTGIQTPMNLNGTRKSLYDEYPASYHGKLEQALASLNINGPTTTTNIAPTLNALGLDTLNTKQQQQQHQQQQALVNNDDLTSSSSGNSSANNSINGQLPINTSSKMSYNNTNSNRNWAGIVGSQVNGIDLINNNKRLPPHNNQQQLQPQNFYQRPNYTNYNNNNNNKYNQLQPQSQQQQQNRLSNRHQQGQGQQQESLQIEYNSQYNPKEFNLIPKGARFFVIKSYSEDDVHRSIKFNIWCSTEHGNRRLDQAYREREGKGPVYLFFSVNGSGHFCGMAEMCSHVDYESKSQVWSQDKWKGRFDIKWVFIKDIPNSQLRNIRLENNENKPVTNSRDTQEVPFEKGKQVLKVFYHYRHTTSIFDDFEHYEKRLDEDHKKSGTNVDAKQ